MRDMKEGIKKAIDNYDEHGVSVELTEREKELIEYGYVQCALQIGYDIASKGESFMAGLQEMVLKCAAIDKADEENKIYDICGKVLAITEEEVKEVRAIAEKQKAYMHPFKLATANRQHELGEYNDRVINKLLELKEVIKSGDSIK